MHHLPRLFCNLMPALLGLLLAAPIAHANILGFGDFAGWQINQNDSQAAPAISLSPSGIHLTGPAIAEERSIFNNTPQNTSQPFTASFTYQESGSVNNGAGFDFVMQNSAAGSKAIGGGFGYAGISPSVAVEFQMNDFSSAVNNAGVFTNGDVGPGTDPLSPVSLFSGDPINVQISYDGTFLREFVTDTVTHQASATGVHIATLPASAYVGITAGNGDAEDQFFSNFQFSAVPEPGSLVLFGIGGITLVAYFRRRMEGKRRLSLFRF